VKESPVFIRATVLRLQTRTHPPELKWTVHTFWNSHQSNTTADTSDSHNQQPATSTMPSNDALLTNLGSDLELWSPSLKTHSKPADVLADKIVMIYFSASWCPRKFFFLSWSCLFAALFAASDHGAVNQLSCRCLRLMVLQLIISG